MTLAEELAEADVFYGPGHYVVPPVVGASLIERYGRLPHGVHIAEPIPFTRITPAPAARPFGGAHWKQRR